MKVSNLKSQEKKKKAQKSDDNVSTQSVKMKKNPDIVFKVAELIRKRREESGLNQVELSKLSGVDQAYISRIERGMKPGFTFGIIAKLFTAMNISWSELDELKIKSNPTPENNKKLTRGERILLKVMKERKEKKENK